LVKDENGYLLADPRYILNRQKDSFYQLLNVHAVKDIRQTEIHAYIHTYIHTAEPLVGLPEPNSFEAESVKFKSYKSP
jgi:hypothetical protein